jgi:hypothetical protein
VWSRRPDAGVKPADDASHRAGDGGKKARLTKESTKETVKTIAQGGPDVTGKPVATLLVCFFILHAGLWVRAAHPAFPAPSLWASVSFDNSGRAGRENAELRLSCCLLFDI